MDRNIAPGSQNVGSVIPGINVIDRSSDENFLGVIAMINKS